MKYLLLIGMIMAGLVLVQFAQGQSVDQLIDKYAEARGALKGCWASKPFTWKVPV